MEALLELYHTMGNADINHMDNDLWKPLGHSVTGWGEAGGML